MNRPEKITYSITKRVSWTSTVAEVVTGYRVSPNFAARKVGGHYQLDHPATGMFVGGISCRTLADATSDAQRLERATYPNGHRFHWETITLQNANLRVKRAGQGFLSRALGRKVGLARIG